MSNKPTVGSQYQSVQNYLEDIQRVYGQLPQKRFQIRPIDVFLMRQIASFHMVSPTVLDLAADVTAGASLAMWMDANHIVEKVFPVQSDATEEDIFNWRKMLLQHLVDSDLFEVEHLDLDLVEDQEKILEQVSLLSSLMVVLVYREGKRGVPWLEKLLALSKNIIVCVLPVGQTGESGTLEALLEIGGRNSAHQVTLMREQSPFLFESQLALLYHRSDEFVVRILERCVQQFKGNFDFLQLAEESVELDTARKELEHLKTEFRKLQTILEEERATLGEALAHEEEAFISTQGSILKE